METHLADFIKHTTAGREAEEILQRCVHCGFCTATCPTYQLLGDELDGPRGRIYLIKQVLEGAEPTEKTRLHLDRCLSCRSCESTCPSGVHYTRLLDIGREVVERKVPRTGGDALMRGALKNFLPRSTLFGTAMKLGQAVRLVLPGALRAKVPPLSSAGPAPQRSHARKMIALAGCVQPSMYPNVNGATRRVLDRLGIQMIEARGAGCCGAVRLHLNEAEGARDDARRNIDAWWPLLESGGAEGLVMTASGCGSHVLEYAHLLQDDPDYALKAARVVLATRDISEVVAAEAEALTSLLQACHPLPEGERALAFHSPCSLQHGLKIRGTVESLLTSAGYTLTAVADSHLCCGSAGTYSVLQPEISQRLQANKIAALSAGRPAAIASANVGCMAHLQGVTALPVRHWIELLDTRLS
ncbi:glycolate oxidase subunit GlcF [Sulfuritalea hydrogenivorans]|uniref:Glycolate oxidase iron-sulfur subunit n=1 Tax=Sulfuritalea hydrogenivorans sk43H TaxID=1223802 RepID=W0SIE5_9PROT|nr:glycolate oxidase subunit GlcF [Sulfuritalea hydrogenivorans]MDK9714326.1 glycolate oxidase subunit GlcF [Sulfuritalea sp.]BAO30710.1 glycolate oxidase iron-sulfur subunit [Sulfuritalea hydrogenivorans sk43H]